MIAVVVTVPEGAKDGSGQPIAPGSYARLVSGVSHADSYGRSLAKSAAFTSVFKTAAVGFGWSRYCEIVGETDCPIIDIDGREVEGELLLNCG